MKKSWLLGVLMLLADLPPVHGAEAKNDTASKESEG